MATNFCSSAWVLLDAARRLVAQPGGLTLGFALHLIGLLSV